MQQLEEATLDEVSAFHARVLHAEQRGPDHRRRRDRGRGVRQGRDATSATSLRATLRSAASRPPRRAGCAGEDRHRRGRSVAGASGSPPGCPPTSRAHGSWPPSNSPPSILGEGETSHLHRRLVRQDQTAVSAGIGVNTLIAGQLARGGIGPRRTRRRTSTRSSPPSREVLDAVRRERARRARAGDGSGPRRAGLARRDGDRVRPRRRDLRVRTAVRRPGPAQRAAARCCARSPPTRFARQRPGLAASGARTPRPGSSRRRCGAAP